MGKKALLAHIAKLMNAALPAADLDTSGISVMSARNNAGDRTLSTTRRTDQSDEASGRENHIHTFQDLARGIIIKSDIR